MSLIAWCVSRLSGSGSGIRLQSLRVRNRLPSCFSAFLCALFFLLLGSAVAQTNTPEAAATPPPAVDLQQLLKISAQMQEQLQLLQRQLAQDREAAQAAAVRETAALSNSLRALEQTFAAERARELDTWNRSSQAMEKSNRLMLVVAGILAGTGFLALLILTWFQWRATSKLAELSTAWPASRTLESGGSWPMLGPAVASEAVASANDRLVGALDQLDRRLHDLKRAVAGSNGAQNAGVGRVLDNPENPRIAALLDQANASLKAEKIDEALASFDEVLSLAPNHTEALVKKGAVLERMHKLNEAIACYDRAIAADSSQPFAYLHKGGLCSRLERFKEALECYEKALRTHEQREN